MQVRVSSKVIPTPDGLSVRGELGMIFSDTDEDQVIKLMDRVEAGLVLAGMRKCGKCNRYTHNCQIVDEWVLCAGCWTKDQPKTHKAVRP